MIILAALERRTGAGCAKIMRKKEKDLLEKRRWIKKKDTFYWPCLKSHYDLKDEAGMLVMAC